MCTKKRAYRTAAQAKLSDPLMYQYRCPICFSWHNTSIPNINELDRILNEETSTRKSN